MILAIGLWTFLRTLLTGSAAVALESLALRHQLLVLQRSVRRPRLARRDRVLWVWLSQVWAGWRSSLVIVQPATVLAWHRQGFRLYWRWRSSIRPAGRPRLDAEASHRHAFPTYVTPRVVVRADLRGRDGRPVRGSFEERTVGREVPLDLSCELADTRILPGASFVLSYRRVLDRPGLRLRVVVTVEPDHFYTRFFESVLAQGAGKGTAGIREALAATRRSAFVLYEHELPLT